MTALLYTVVGYCAGSLMFSLWLGRLALHKDVRRYGDGNPGAFNMILAGGVGWGALALMLDVIKGAIPVLLARYVSGVSGAALIPVVLAPVFGHAFSPWLNFHGGKAVAVTFGVWAGLTLWEAPGVLGVWLGVWFLLLAVSGWAVVLMMLGLLAYLLLVTPSPVLLTIWVVNAALLAWKYRADLRLFPEPRPWLKARLRWSR
jgi:glycerol-3-phosphate acyltransferase PlsY